MAETKQPGATGKPGFVVLKEIGQDQWRVVGQAARKPGRPARAARIQAIMAATKGKAKAGEIYAAVLRSEWRIAQDW